MDLSIFHLLPNIFFIGVGHVKGEAVDLHARFHIIDDHLKSARVDYLFYMVDILFGSQHLLFKVFQSVLADANRPHFVLEVLEGEQQLLFNLLAEAAVPDCLHGQVTI